MKTYRLSFIKNIKRGFLTIPFGLFILFFMFIVIQTEIDFWIKILLILLFSLVGLPGLILHGYYFLHDISLRIDDNPQKDYFDFINKGQIHKIVRTEIESIEKVHHNSYKNPLRGYMKFKIKLKNGNEFSITNLSIDFEELFEITRIKDRQLNIFNKFRFM